MITFLKDTIFWSNSLLDYSQAIGIFVIAYAIGKIIALIAQKKGMQWAQKTHSILDDQFVKFVSSFASLVGIFVGLFLAKEILTIPTIANMVLNISILAVVIVFVTGVGQKFVLLAARNSIGRLLKKNTFGKTIFPFFEKLIIAILWATALIIFLSNVGINVSSLVAGLGIGGLAFALAAKDTLGNFIASLSIFVDQPFQVGDMVRIGDTEGTVAEVGIRSTRIQSFQGNTQFILPNSQVADSVIENVSKRDGVRFDFVIGLVYSTSAKQLEHAIEIVREILKEHPEIQEGYWVRFFEFGDFSLNIKVRMNVSRGRGTTFGSALEVREQVNFKIMEQFEKAHLEFAFPTQTIELKK